MNTTTTKGFTLIELLVVVAIIGILAGIIITSLSNAREKARDARREQDMKTIYTALVQYELENGSIPKPHLYGTSVSGWDISNDGSFLSFLVDGGILSHVPVDPINVGVVQLNPGDHLYRYSCYPSGSSTPGLRLEYRRESDNTLVVYSKIHALGKVNGQSDGFFNCET